MIKGMVPFLRRLFIKDYRNVADPEVRARHGVLAATIGLVLNLLLVGAKLTAAIVLASKSAWVFSMALVGDALNNVSDFASCVVTLIGFSLSKKPADRQHPYGHRRLEYLTGLIVAVLILVAAAELLIQSLTKAIEGAEVRYDVLALAVLGGSILLKGLQGYVTLGLSKAIDSPALKATAMDSFLDVSATSTLLLGGLITYFSGFAYLDAYLGIAVSLFVGFSGVRMIIEEANPLIGSAFSAEKQRQIILAATAFTGVLGVHDVLAHDYGPGMTFLSLHVEVDERTPLLQAHGLAEEVERDLSERFGYAVTVHVDPVRVGDEALNREKEEILACLRQIDPAIGVHDMHRVEGAGKSALRFDVTLPFGCDQKAVDLALTKTGERLGVAIEATYEHPFAS